MVDLTAVTTAIVEGIFGVVMIIIPIMIQSHMKDKQAAVVLSNAVVNSLGAIKQAALEGKQPPIIPGVPPQVAEGVRYVMDHAREEAGRSNQTPAMIADKISAKQGLQALATDVAAAAPPAATPIPVADV